jgi:NADPH-dependent F420 reductase
MSTLSVAVIGGTGPQGRGLAYRLITGGDYEIILGSRDEARAVAAADELAARLNGAATVSGGTNFEAARKADVVLLAIPYEGHDDLVASLREVVAGKIVISCVNPLGFDSHGVFGLVVPGGSAAETAAALLPEATIVGAFHHLSAVTLLTPEPLFEHVLVVGEDREAKQIVIEMARAITDRPGVDAGPLRLARQLEPLTAVLISVNRAYKTHAGLRVTGLAVTSY